MDDGRALGSIQNDECKIDSLAQSWSVISNAGDNDKKYISMESLENHLIDKENGIIKIIEQNLTFSNYIINFNEYITKKYFNNFNCRKRRRENSLLYIFICV